ncbi:DNA-directed RNA polymerases I, II, and III subunit RPABC4 [Ascosphaera pollenicola]|nr:DNA-directed RNA polymerases I, II, and III subunit RPABC4 [Ascosphaera pollenicola]
MAAPDPSQPEPVSIAPLLTRLAHPGVLGQDVVASEIAAAFALIFENRLSQVQMASFLTLLHATGKDRDPDVIVLCAERMREAAKQVDKEELERVLNRRRRKEGNYEGGFCDIVGTGGDSHKTFNISTTSSIIASPLLLMAKHGNRAQTSLSGSADVLAAIAPKPPVLETVTAKALPKVYETSNYAFLFAPNFHSGMRFAAPVRKGLGLRTIFNLLGPLANPIEWGIEARLVGVAYQSLGPIFAEVLRKQGCRKGIIVCGAEDLDEISCAGATNCWMLKEEDNPDFKESEEECSITNPRKIVNIESFSIQPSDFGVSTHPLSEVGGGKMPDENARILMSILRNELPRDHPILEFVILNVAALMAISGICEVDTSSMGPGDDGKVITERGPGGIRWKEGVRRARWAIESGEAVKSLENFIEASNMFLM